MLGLEHILCIYGRTPNQGSSRSQESRAQVLPVGALHPPVPGLPLLHAAPHVARPLHQVRPQHRQPGAGRPQLPELREVPRPRQDHALHDQVHRPGK